MKPLFVSCVLLSVFAFACLGQGKANGNEKPAITGYVELDGKPLVNGQVILSTVATHMQDYAGVVVPIFIPRGVVIYAEKPAGAYEDPDWSTSKKTDKSGHFSITIPEKAAGTKLQITILAVPMSGKTDKATIARFQNGACLTDVIQPGGQDVRYNLDPGISMAHGACRKDSK